MPSKKKTKQTSRGEYLRSGQLSSEDDNFEPKKKKAKMEVKMEMILDEMVNIKETLGDVMFLTKFTEIPLGLKRTKRDTFKCHICHCVPIVPPVSHKML